MSKNVRRFLKKYRGVLFFAVVAFLIFIVSSQFATGTTFEKQQSEGRIHITTSAGEFSVDPVVAGIEGVPIRIQGSGFGNPGPEKSVRIRSGKTVDDVASMSDRVVTWNDHLIEINLNSGSRSGTLELQIDDGRATSSLRLFRYDWFDLAPVAWTVSPPLALTIGPDRRVWINQEFHVSSFQVLDPSTGIASAITIPQADGSGIFASQFKEVGDIRARMSALGEDIMVDPQGRVWLTEGGWNFYTGNQPNHSRIVSFDPRVARANQFRIYNLPGDNNGVIGVAWDQTRGRVWFAEGANGPKLVSFDPEQVAHDNEFDFSTSLDDLMCPKDGPYNNCYRVYDLPRHARYPSHVAVDDEGFVWVSLFWGNAIARLNPDTGEFTEVPLANQRSAYRPRVGGGPWAMAFDGQGNLAFTEFIDLTIGRFRLEDAERRECLRRSEGKNPCIEERIVLPNDHKDGYGVHSLAYDNDKNLWFTTTASNIDDNDLSIGFITADFKQVVTLPPLKQFPASDSVHSAGIAIDERTGAIWFAEYERKRIGRLLPLP